MALAGYRTGGVNEQTAGIRNILAFYGTTAPHTKEPYTEAMLFGIGGGCGVSYWTWEFKGCEPLATIFFRNLNEKEGSFVSRLCQRINAPLEVLETGSRAKALKSLRDALERGRPPLAALDMASMPYLFQPPELIKWFGHEAVICGLDEAAGIAELDDRAPVHWQVPLETLADSRAAITSFKNRLHVIEPPTEYPDLTAAIEAGIRDCVTTFTDPPIGNLGLPGLEKWAKLVTNKRDKKGWPTVFPRGIALYEALVSTYNGIVTVGTGGDALRGFYATFLREAAGVTGNAAYTEAAAAFDVSGKLWAQLANNLLPDSVPTLRKTRSLLNTNRKLFETEGQPVIPGMANNIRQLGELRTTVVQDGFPVSQEAVDELLQGLSEQLMAIHEVESGAVATLAATLPGS